MEGDLADEGTSIATELQAPVSGRFMFAYTLAQFTAWLAILPAAMITVALKVSRIATADEKSLYLSTIVSLGAFGALVAAPVFGAISDRTRVRIGRRKLWMAFGCAGLFAGLLTVALSTTLVGLAIGWVICQTCSNAGQAALNALMPDVVPQRQQGRMSALLGITTSAAGVFGAFLTQFTAGNNLVMFLVPWLAYPFALGFLMASFKDRPVEPQPPFSAVDLLRTFWVNPVRYPDFGWAFASRFFMFFAVSCFGTYQLYFLTDQIRMQEGRVLNALFLSSLITTALALILTPVSGWLSDRIGRRKPLVFAAGIVASAGLLAMGGANSFVQFILCATIIGVGLAIYYAVDIALCVAVLPDPKNAAKDMGVLQIANSLPQSLAPAVAPLFLAIGAGAHANYPALFAASAIIGALGAAMVLPIRRSR